MPWRLVRLSRFLNPFENTFHFDMIADLQKSCKNAKNSYFSCPGSLAVNIFPHLLLCWHVDPHCCHVCRVDMILAFSEPLEMELLRWCPVMPKNYRVFPTNRHWFGTTPYKPGHQHPHLTLQLTDLMQTLPLSQQKVFCPHLSSVGSNLKTHHI